MLWLNQDDKWLNVPVLIFAKCIHYTALIAAMMATINAERINRTSQVLSDSSLPIRTA